MLNKLLYFTASIFLLVSSNSLMATTHDSNSLTIQYESVYELGIDDLMTLDKESLERVINRKLTLSERISLPLVKRKLKKMSGRANEATLQELKKDGLAVAGFVLGIVGLFIWLLSPIAIILSIISLRKIKSDPESLGGKKLAIAGLVLGIVGTVILIALTSFVIGILAGIF